MLGNFKGLVITLLTAMRKPITAQYPESRLPIEPRRMGFPMLTWDQHVEEPYCTGCMVCIRECPTKCMTANMMDNPLYQEGRSPRRKIIESFEINIGRCILCGICVDVCNFDAIEMTYETELSDYIRNGRRMDLPELLQRGWTWQQQTEWKSSKELQQAATQTPMEQGSQNEDIQP